VPVLYEKRGHVAYLTLSRPEARNCWGEDYNEELARLCEDLAADDDVRVAVLTGDEAGVRFPPVRISRTRRLMSMNRLAPSSGICRSGAGSPANC
jgi:hypothetical protein